MIVAPSASNYAPINAIAARYSTDIRYSLMVELRNRPRSRHAVTLWNIVLMLLASRSGSPLPLKNSIGSATCAADGQASSTMPSISGAPAVTGRTTSLRT